MTRVFVAAGSNIEPEHNLACACREIARHWSGVRFSRAYRNRAVGFDGPDFVNLVVEFRSTQTVPEVQTALREIETLCGRPDNAPKWASRSMDLDILMFGERIEKTAEYTLPRPDLLKRPYMLGPMAELAPEILHPVEKRSIGELWNAFDRAGHEMIPVVLGGSASG